ncbi:MerR family transcriptional regulator [Actinocorallia longicatena]|uniref:MerR family transcriptional regulator n=1 Tax=Actinocorallia longicatena TaxID=111803 RepID=A0ABP6QL35_9ACTN
MDGTTLYSIGDLARMTGLTVKAIRFYSDEGIVPPTDRSPAGHRRYDPDAAARLGLIRTLRDLDLDLPTIRRIVDREVPLAVVAAAHADALAVQMRLLRMRHAVLTAAARRGSTPEEIALMHRFAKLTESERHQLVADFLDTTFTGADLRFDGIRRSLTPELPDDPDSAQIEAWIELAELTQDRSFRALLRTLFTTHADDDARHAGPPRKHVVALVAELVPPALAAGLPPGSPGAATIVTEVTTAYAAFRAHPDDEALRRRLAAYLTAAGDPRRARYLTLLSTVNGWSPPEDPRPALAWFLEALRAGEPTGAEG